MGDIYYFKKFVLCKIMWHDVVVIWQLVGAVAIANWWMMWTPCMLRELH
jgi:hypothetical protein